MMRYTRTQHRSASRQVNDHGRVSGTHTSARTLGWTSNSTITTISARRSTMTRQDTVRSWPPRSLRVDAKPGEPTKRHLANRIIRRMWRDATTRQQPHALAA